MMEQTVSIERMEDAIDIFGSFDENIRLIEQELGVRVVGRDDQLKSAERIRRWPMPPR